MEGLINMSIPTNLRYSEDHEWVLQENGTARIGITEFAQSELGDIVFVELPAVGDELKIAEPFGSVESVKTVSELYAPVSGTVVAINEELEDSPEFVNESPYDKAWMVEVKLSDASEVDSLLTPEQYEGVTAE